MVVVKRLLFRVLLLLSLLVIVAEVWGATTRRKKSTTTTPKKRIRKSTTRTTVKSTTTSPKTESPIYQFCRNYNRIKKKVHDTAQSEDFIIGTRDFITEIFDDRDRQHGSFYQRGRKQLKFHFESFYKVEYDRAVEACLYRKLHLLALDTADEIDDFYFYWRGEIVGYEDREFLWTSAAPCSKSDPLNKATNSCSSVTWCPNNVETRLNYTLNLSNFTRPYCIIFRTTGKKFEPMDCSFKSIFSCESACSRPILPPKNECQKDVNGN
ncbi:uncharacterized protein LOC135935998 [Cloeon dipterum]|uniref:uncharacterized protein LOC135935998 n=1 Tax=Cloeon dipterum TaxID=197152 RepID=UPI00321FD9E6